MRKIIAIFILVNFFTACGGGGGGDAQPVAQISNSGGSTSNSGSSASNPSSSTSNSGGSSASSQAIASRVIDGYITGANVFIDFNYNLIQDSGEPSASPAESGEPGSYVFDYENDFNAITDFSEACAKRRIQIAEIPAGAVDSELGEVDKAFTMFYVPYGGGSVNITPFTGLYMDFLKDAKKKLKESLNMKDDESLDITVADGCGAVSDALATKFATKSATFASELNTSYSAVLKDLYGDYIADLDNTTKQKAEKIVGYLKVASDIKETVKTNFNNKYQPSVSLSEGSIASIFGANDISSLPLSINIQHTGPADSDGWSDVFSYFTSGVRVLLNGKIAKASCSEIDANNCTLFDPTYENIKNNLDWYFSYGGSSNSSIIDGATIESRYRESKEINNQGSTSCSQAAKLDMQGNKSCSGSGCPTSIKFEYEITHNRGFQALDGCDVTDNPYVYLFTQRINKSSDVEDRYGFQYSLKDENEIYNAPPTNFLGANKTNVNYQNAFNKLEELFVPMSSISSVENKLKINEFISVYRNLEQKTDGETTSGNRYNLIISTDGSTLDYNCKIYTWSASLGGYDFDNPVETTGNIGYTNCYNELISWNFHN